MKSVVSQASRHLVVRFEDSETLPDSLLDALRENAVATGWVRASGIVTELEIKAFRTDLVSLGTVRRIPGPVQILSLEGSVGLAKGQLSVGLRVVVARETESGLETISGELVSARIAALEAFVTSLDDVACGRTLDAGNIWLLDPAPGSAPSPATERNSQTEFTREAPSPSRPAVATKLANPESPWAQAVAASSTERERPAQDSLKSQIPQRPQKAAAAEEADAPFPEAGDVVEHFAFGRCEVVKSDGDRLHLKVGKDGRIREIALEMLRVSPLESNEPSRKRFKLDRKL
jgi:predicted DNA-binding protein with PD1-like motif